jgi:hypothetical protein
MSDKGQKVAIITGGSQDIGASLVTAYRQQGWSAVATARAIKPAEDPDVLTIDGEGLVAASPVRPVLGATGGGGLRGEEAGDLGDGQRDHSGVGGRRLAGPRGRWLRGVGAIRGAGQMAAPSRRGVQTGGSTDRYMLNA